MRYLLLLCAWIATSMVAHADVELKNVSLQYGTSPRMLPRSWAFFNYRVVNNDDEPANIEVLLRPVAQRNITIYSKKLTVPPRSDLRARMLVTIGTVEEYKAEIIRDGMKQGVGEDVLISLGSPTNQMVYFVNDELDLEYGNFAKNNELQGTFKTTFVRADKVPSFWSGYDHVHLLVLMRPDFASMSERQMDAIVDYVSRGGTVLFDDPQGLVDAAETRLGVLLNLEPLRIRKLEKLTALEAIGGSAIHWPEGEDFLESQAVGPGVTTLWQDGMPVLRWSRYGLGLVGCAAINPSQSGFREPEANFNVIWNHILTFGGRSPWPSTEADVNVVEALNQMTGIRIPSRQAVRRLVATYLLVIVVVILVGKFTRRQLTAWVGLAGLSVLVTLSLFLYSRVLTRDLPARTATLVAFETWGPERLTGDQITSLMIKSEDQLDLLGPSEAVVLRALVPDTRDRAARAALPEPSGPSGPPGQGQYVDRGTDEVLADPIHFTESASIYVVQGLIMQPKAPKIVAGLYARDAVPAVDLPRLHWSAAGPKLDPWAPPPGLKVEHAILLCETGYLHLAVENGRVQLRRGGTIMSPPPDVVAMQRFLSAIATPAPALVLFSHAQADGAGVLPENFTVTGQLMTMVPVIQDLSTDSLISLPPERIRLTPRRGSGAQIQSLMPIDGMLGPASPIVGHPGPDGKAVDEPRDFLFTVRLPPGFNSLQPSAARVHFEADARGGNVTFALFLRPWDADAKDRSRDVAATRTEDHVWTFENLPPGFCNPGTGECQLVLRESQKTKIYVNRTDAIRPNAWVVKTLQMAVDGRLSSQNRGQL